MKLQKAIPEPLDGGKYVNGHDFYFKLSRGGVEDKIVNLAFKYRKQIVFNERRTIHRFCYFFHNLVDRGRVKQTEDHKKWVFSKKEIKGMEPLSGRHV